VAESESHPRHSFAGKRLISLLTGHAPLWRVFWMGVVPLGAAFVLVSSLRPIADSGFAIGIGFLLWMAWSLVVIWRASYRSRPLVRYLSRTLSVAAPVLAVLIPSYCYVSTDQVDLWQAVALTHSHRTALAIACEEGTFRPGISNENGSLGLATPHAYASEYTYSITTKIRATDSASVEIVLKDIGDDIRDGQTVVIDGRCAGARMNWTVGGTIPEKFRKRLARVVDS
jgi:hypothetical protein